MANFVLKVEVDLCVLYYIFNKILSLDYCLMQRFKEGHFLFTNDKLAIDIFLPSQLMLKIKNPQ